MLDKHDRRGDDCESGEREDASAPVFSQGPTAREANLCKDQRQAATLNRWSVYDGRIEARIFAASNTLVARSASTSGNWTRPFMSMVFSIAAHNANEAADASYFADSGESAETGLAGGYQ